MPRYKDADKMIEFINTHLPYSASPDFMDGVNDCIRMIDDKNAIPTADVKEVVYGEWEVIGKGRFRCSKCGAEEYRCIVERNECMANSCWNCGVEMKKECNI